MSSSKSSRRGSENAATVTDINDIRKGNEMSDEASGFDEFSADATTNPNPEVDNDNFDAWDSDAFGDLDIDNLPELTDGTYRMALSEIKLFTPDEQHENPLMHKVRMSVIWSVHVTDDTHPHAHLAGETVTQYFDLYPRFQQALVKNAKDITEVKNSVKKLKRQLRDPLKYTGKFHPKAFKELYLNLLADVEVRVNYSEKAEKNFANVQNISPVADDADEAAWSGSSY